MRMLALRADARRDPDAAHLCAAVDAHLALARARHLRRRCAALLVLTALIAWGVFHEPWILSRRVHSLVAALATIALARTAWAALGEWRWLRRLRRSMRAVVGREIPFTH